MKTNASSTAIAAAKTNNIFIAMVGILALSHFIDWLKEAEVLAIQRKMAVMFAMIVIIYTCLFFSNNAHIFPIFLFV